MKSYKQILNEWAQQTSILHEMTEEERKGLQAILVEMLKDLQSLCETNNLALMLTGGSCLGAVRHKGFIPWDDDLDLMMSRADYEKLIELLNKGAMSEKYEYRYPDGNMDSSCCFLKIYKKGTVFGTTDPSPYPESIFLDIFPIDGVPSSSIKRMAIANMANVLRLISNCVAGYKFPSETSKIAQEEYPELKDLMKKRMLIGRLFSFINHKKWKLWFDRLVACKEDTEYMTIATGRNLYKGEINRKDVFFPPHKIEFEGVEVLAPNNTDAYLSNMYGDYMQIPPIEKRERHFIETLKF